MTTTRKPIILTRIPFKSLYGYIYMTTCLVNNRKYIGQHVWQYPCVDPNYYGSGTALLNAVKKYGKENFIVDIIDWATNENDLNTLEILYIDLYDAVDSKEFYNIVSGGGHPPVFSGKDHPLYGTHLSEERKERNRQAQLGHKPSIETRKKIGIASTGRTHIVSDESRKLMSEIRLTRPDLIKQCEKFVQWSKENCAVKVVQLTNGGEFIKEFNSIREAGEFTGTNVSCIADCIHKIQRIANNCRWLLAKEYFSKDSEYWVNQFRFSHSGTCKQVVRLNLNGELEKIYPMLKDVENDGYNRNSVGQYIRKGCYDNGYKNKQWMFYLDYLKLIEGEQ